MPETAINLLYQKGFIDAPVPNNINLVSMYFYVGAGQKEKSKIKFRMKMATVSLSNANTRTDDGMHALLLDRSGGQMTVVNDRAMSSEAVFACACVVLRTGGDSRSESVW